MTVAVVRGVAAAGLVPAGPGIGEVYSVDGVPVVAGYARVVATTVGEASMVRWAETAESIGLKRLPCYPAAPFGGSRQIHAGYFVALEARRRVFVADLDTELESLDLPVVPSVAGVHFLTADSWYDFYCLYAGRCFSLARGHPVMHPTVKVSGAVAVETAGEKLGGKVVGSSLDEAAEAHSEQESGVGNQQSCSAVPRENSEQRIGTAVYAAVRCGADDSGMCYLSLVQERYRNQARTSLGANPLVYDVLSLPENWFLDLGGFAFVGVSQGLVHIMRTLPGSSGIGAERFFCVMAADRGWWPPGSLGGRIDRDNPAGCFPVSQVLSSSSTTVILDSLPQVLPAGVQIIATCESVRVDLMHMYPSNKVKPEYDRVDGQDAMYVDLGGTAQVPISVYDTVRCLAWVSAEQGSTPVDEIARRRAVHTITGVVPHQARFGLPGEITSAMDAFVGWRTGRDSDVPLVPAGLQHDPGLPAYLRLLEPSCFDKALEACGPDPTLRQVLRLPFMYLRVASFVMEIVEGRIGIKPGWKGELLIPQISMAAVKQSDWPDGSLGTRLVSGLRASNMLSDGWVGLLGKCNLDMRFRG